MSNLIKIILIGIIAMGLFGFGSKKEEPGRLSEESYPPPDFLQKPLYVLQHKLDRVNLTASINDVPVFEYNRNSVAGPTGGEPISIYMTNRWNSFTVDMEPIEGLDGFHSATDIDISIMVLDIDNEDDHYPITLIKANDLGSYDEKWAEASPFGQAPGFYSTHKKGMSKIEKIEDKSPKLVYEVSEAIVSKSPIYENGIRISRKFRTNTMPLPHWKWLEGDEISNTPEMRDSLLKTMKQLYDWTQSNNSIAISTVPVEANLEIQDSFYERNLTFSEAIKDVKEYYKNNDFFADIYEDYPDAKLQPWEPDKYKLRVYGNGKLAELAFFEEGKGWRPPIRWLQETDSTDEWIFHRYIFRLDGNKWIATR